MSDTAGHRERDEFQSACQAARSALRWAERRAEWFMGALAKKMALDGVPVSEIASRIGVTVRQARAAVTRPLIPYAVMAGQPIDRLDAIQSAMDDVVKHTSGIDAGELWDWARIFDVENGETAHSLWALDDNVTQALADVRLYSRRLRDAGIDDEARSEAERKYRLAQCRARTFGADQNTITNLAAS